jgi:hypothetical protein
MPPTASPDQESAATPAVSAAERRILGLAVLLLAIQISPWYYSQRDATAYFSIARNLAHGEGLQCMGSPVVWFPPGYPLLLSPLFALRYLPLLEISIVHWLLAVAFLWGIYRWARSLTPVGAIWIAALSVGTNAVWIHYREPISETAFMAAMAWLLVSLRALGRPRNPGAFLGWLAAAFGLTIVMCLIRSVGVALAAGGACALLSGVFRNWFSSTRSMQGVNSRRLMMAALFVCAAAAITVGGVILRERWVARPLGAATYLTSLEARRGTPILDNYGPWFSLVVSEIGRTTIPFMFKSHGYVGWWWDVNMLIYVPWFVLLLFGYSRWICFSNDPLAWSLPFYLAVLTYFRWESGARWWVPMTPAFMTCLWFALEPWKPRRQRIMRAFWFLHLLAALVYWIGSEMPRARNIDKKWPTVRSLADQITADRDGVIIDASLTDLGNLLDLQLDRRVKEHSGDIPLPASARWLILPDDKRPPPGFALRSSSGGCTLFQRVDLRE